MIVVNWLMLRPLFRPLERLAGRMAEADVLRGRRSAFPSESAGEVGALERAFNSDDGTARDRAARGRRTSTERRRKKSGSGSRAASTTRSAKR